MSISQQVKQQANQQAKQQEKQLLRSKTCATTCKGCTVCKGKCSIEDCKESAFQFFKDSGLPITKAKCSKHLTESRLKKEVQPVLVKVELVKTAREECFKADWNDGSLDTNVASTINVASTEKNVNLAAKKPCKLVQHNPHMPQTDEQRAKLILELLGQMSNIANLKEINTASFKRMKYMEKVVASNLSQVTL